MLMSKTETNRKLQIITFSLRKKDRDKLKEKECVCMRERMKVYVC